MFDNIGCKLRTKTTHSESSIIFVILNFNIETKPILIYALKTCYCIIKERENATTQHYKP